LRSAIASPLKPTQTAAATATIKNFFITLSSLKMLVKKGTFKPI